MERVQPLTSPKTASPATPGMGPLTLVLQPMPIAGGAAGGRVGELPWQALVGCESLKDAVPATLRVDAGTAEPLLIPCVVSPGRRSWRLRVSLEPTPIPTWPACGVSPRELVAAVARAGTSARVDHLDWMLPTWAAKEVMEDLDGLELPAHATLNGYETWVIPLQSDYEAVHKTFKGNTRREIRYARERGVTVVAEPTRDQLLQFARLWRSCYQERGWEGPFYSEQFFLAAPRYLGAGGKMVLAEADGRVVAGALFVDEGPGAFHYMGAMDRAYKDHFAMMGIFDHALRALCAEGKEYLNLGGVGASQDLAVFKQKWGAEARMIPVLRCSRELSPLPAPLRAANAAVRRGVSSFFRIYRGRYQRALARELQP